MKETNNRPTGSDIFMITMALLTFAIVIFLLNQ